MKKIYKKNIKKDQAHKGWTCMPIQYENPSAIGFYFLSSRVIVSIAFLFFKIEK